jgi:hypothetical protein
VLAGVAAAAAAAPRAGATEVVDGCGCAPGVGSAAAARRLATDSTPLRVCTMASLSVRRAAIMPPPRVASIAMKKTGTVPIRLASVCWIKAPVYPPPQPHAARL